MNTNNFQLLIQKITGRPFVITTSDSEIVNGKEYIVSLKLPLTGRNVGFKWKAATTDEKLLRSFITAFCTKYREPNPANYTTCPPYFSPSWDEKTELEREYAYSHHASNMYSKEQLMKQVEDSFNSPDMQTTLIKYGFYSTEYGIGIFCFWMTKSVQGAIENLQRHLTALSIPFKNEYSDARWVFRFKLGLNKEQHTAMLNGLQAA